MALREIIKKGIRVPSVSISTPLKHGRSSILQLLRLPENRFLLQPKTYQYSLSALSYKGLVVVEYWQKNPLYGGFMQVQNCWQREEMRIQLD
ncbi:hypothetical protein LWI29_033067 [Acer saccharum]|uniref:Uncharacterized protein n=1 Tax=Acer saccharum TaxID=4024 RepID=A0AA39SW67_ACESA|nr:hypothetical protein LWI29_033067 [Acer saccharum]